MLRDIQRYIVTVETSKHRFFVFLDTSILPDNKLVNIALKDASSNLFIRAIPAPSEAKPP